MENSATLDFYRDLVVIAHNDTNACGTGDAVRCIAIFKRHDKDDHYGVLNIKETVNSIVAGECEDDMPWEPSHPRAYWLWQGTSAALKESARDMIRLGMGTTVTAEDVDYLDWRSLYTAFLQRNPDDKRVRVHISGESVWSETF